MIYKEILPQKLITCKNKMRLEGEQRLLADNGVVFICDIYSGMD